MRWQPHNYQKHAVEFCVQQGTAGLFLDPGLGKTSIMLTVFYLLRKKGLARRALVIAPLRPAYAVWPAEAQRWDHLNDLRVNVLHGPRKDERLRAEADVDVVNPEGLDWLLRSVKGEWPWDILIVDESTRFKHSDTQRFKLLKPVLHKFKRRYILTGSPAPNGLLDLWGQIYILDGGYSLGLYYSHYRAMYFNPSGFQGYDWKIRGGAEEEIYEKLKPLVLRMSAEDYLELPELINNTVEVELPPAALRTYRQMEATLLADLEDGTVTAANAVAATGKCRQIANGGIYHEGAEKWTNLHQVKADAVAELVEELSGKPCLVAYEYRHDLERLRKHFPDAPHIGGGVSAGRFREIERSWNRGEVPVLLAQPQSVAHGLNLQGTGAAVIWHSLTWDLEIYEQFIRRVWRQGQKERVFVHHVLAKETIDKVIMQMLRSKDRTQRALLGALKTHLKGRRAA